MGRKTSRNASRQYYAVLATAPWKNSGEGAEERFVPKNYRAEVAEVCLNCPEKKCTNLNGCTRYYEALRQIDDGHLRNKGSRLKLVTINDETHCVSEWAEKFGVSVAGMRSHAWAHGIKIEEEIEYRLKKMEVEA